MIVRRISAFVLILGNREGGNIMDKKNPNKSSGDRAEFSEELNNENDKNKNKNKEK